MKYTNNNLRWTDKEEYEFYTKMSEGIESGLKIIHLFDELSKVFHRSPRALRDKWGLMRKEFKINPEKLKYLKFKFEKDNNTFDEESERIVNDLYKAAELINESSKLSKENKKLLHKIDKLELENSKLQEENNRLVQQLNEITDKYNELLFLVENVNKTLKVVNKN
jgi:hypothetical protein